MGATHVPSFVSPSPMNNFRSQSITRYDVSPDDLPILRGDDTADENPDIGEQTPENIFEAVQSPAFSVKYSPASNRPTDTTDLKHSSVVNGPILGNDPDKESDVLEDDEVPTKDERNYIPSEVVDYYNEAAMKTKTRNALPDEVFGLPRTRQYPLNDKKHVMLAIKMFGHCKDPKDKQTLANNIFKAVEKFNLSPKIGKSNPLYDYAPKSLQEATSIPKLTIGGLETPMHKRTREDIIKEHMRKNGLYYNNMFYGPEFFQSVAKIPELSFLEFFYPNLTQMNFFTRLHCICGGLGLSDEVYEQIKMRKPLATDNSEIGWVTPEMLDDAWFVVDSTYSEKANWFGDNTATRNPDHIKYCLRLYSIMGKMLLDPTFDMSMLDEKQFAVLTDWEQHVRYHYGMYKGAENHDEEIREMQYLFDLFWNFNDNPDDYNVRTAMTIGLLNNMVSVTNFIPNMNEANVSGEIVSKEECSAYMVYEMGYSDDIFLLPITLEYPIIDQSSVRLAMDMINKIPEDQIQEYTTNLNRKYRELGCKFSISVDHPYAKYADKNIISNMTCVLLEGDTPVDDQGTSIDIKANQVDDPWYKRVDYTGAVGQNILDNKEMGPNTKPQQKPEYTEYDSFR